MSIDSFRPSRRGFLGLASGAGLLALGAAPAAAARVKTSAKILILGAGAAGTALANRLMTRLEGAEITLLDGRAKHWYQPGFTLIAAGLKPATCWLFNVAMTWRVNVKRKGVKSMGVMLARRPVGWASW